MALKSKGIDSITYLCALSGLLFGVILSFCLDGSSEETMSITRITESLAELPGAALGSVNDGILELAIKFLHFVISKGLQFRFTSPFNHYTSFSKSALFWVALTRSVSSSPVPMDTLR